MGEDEIISKFNKNSKSLLHDEFSKWIPDISYRYTNRPSAIYPTTSSKLPLSQTQPFVDEILDTRYNILILVTELPGVEKKDMRLSINCGLVQIFADGKNKKYVIKIPLKYPVYYNSPKISLTNGVLEITLRLRQNHSSKLSTSHRGGSKNRPKIKNQSRWSNNAR